MNDDKDFESARFIAADKQQQGNKEILFSSTVQTCFITINMVANCFFYHKANKNKEKNFVIVKLSSNTV